MDEGRTVTGQVLKRMSPGASEKKRLFGVKK